MNKFYADKKCVSVQKIVIKHNKKTDFPQIGVWIDDEIKFSRDGILFNGIDFMNRLARNDGFKNYNEFFEWFNTDFEGKIIHWTNLRY